MDQGKFVETFLEVLGLAWERSARLEVELEQERNRPLDLQDKVWKLEAEARAQKEWRLQAEEQLLELEKLRKWSVRLVTGQEFVVLQLPTENELRLIKDGLKLDAIKDVRGRLKLGLKEAKDLVEAWTPMVKGEVPWPRVPACHDPACPEPSCPESACPKPGPQADHDDHGDIPF
jgi:hypothetical protein